MYHFSALKVEAILSTEILVSLYQETQCHILKDNYLDSHVREKLEIRTKKKCLDLEERGVSTPQHVGKISALCFRQKAKRIRLQVPPPFPPPDIVFYTSLAMQTTPTFHIEYEVVLQDPILKVSSADYSVSVITNLYFFIHLSETMFSVAVHGSYLVQYRILCLSFVPSETFSLHHLCAVSFIFVLQRQSVTLLNC